MALLKGELEVDEAKFAELTDALFNGGYFRAKIQGLSKFDKIAGGLAWAIRASRENIDVEFVEDSEIRDQIQVGENIEEALNNMGCRLELKAHQIRGLDCPKLIPVVDWLVKRVKATREEMARSIREYTRLCFRREYGLVPALGGQKAEKMPRLRAKEVPAREFRRTEHNGEWGSIEDHVFSVLLEYGQKSNLVADRTQEKLEGEDETKKISEEERARVAKKEEEILSNLMSGLSGVDSLLSKVGRSMVKNIVHADKDNLAAYAHEYAEKQKKLEEEIQRAEEGKNVAARLEVTLKELQKDKAEQQRVHEEANRVLEEARQEAAAAAAKLEKAKRKNVKIESAIQEIGGELDSKRSKVLKELEHLVVKNEELEELKSKTTVDCKRRLVELKGKLEQIAQEPDITEGDEYKKVQEQFEQEKAKLMKALAVVSKKNREVQNLERQIDAIPTRMELLQYERRFGELYEQVRWKYEETKQYYNKYNTLQETANFLKKEMELFDSIHEGFDGAMANKGTREDFPSSIEKIVETVKKNLDKQKEKLENEKRVASDLADQYNKLTQEQRSYFVDVKHFKEEMEKNRILEEKLELAKLKKGSS